MGIRKELEELRDKKAQEGVLLCKLCKEFKPADMFYRLKAKHSNYGHRYYCKECEYQHKAEKVRKSQNERNRRLKAEALELFGSKCKLCGYDRYKSALQFHHIDPTTKIDNPVTIIYNTGNVEKARFELDKCILVCSNCHMALHSGDIKLDDTGKIISG